MEENPAAPSRCYDILQPLCKAVAKKVYTCEPYTPVSRSRKLRHAGNCSHSRERKRAAHVSKRIFPVRKHTLFAPLRSRLVCLPHFCTVRGGNCAEIGECFSRKGTENAKVRSGSCGLVVFCSSVNVLQKAVQRQEKCVGAFFLRQVAAVG